MPDYSIVDHAVLTFVLMPLALAAALAWGLLAASTRVAEPRQGRRRAIWAGIAVAAWMAITGLAAASGTLRRWDATPPPFALLAISIVIASGWLALGPWGRLLARGLPLWTLIAVQGFRLPLELAMHTMYERGIMPEQMSYSGQNFDILTGITALLVAGACRSGRVGTRVVFAWNVLGLALLANVVVVAILSTPAIRYFGDARLNVWVTYVPFVWLPAVMVVAALAGHLVIFQALRPRAHAHV
jgi:hypothetical protein